MKLSIIDRIRCCYLKIETSLDYFYKRKKKEAVDSEYLI